MFESQIFLKFLQTIILLTIFLNNNFAATETEGSSFAIIFEDIPECFQIIRHRITHCETEFNILDHYKLKDNTIECIMKETIDIPECGQKDIERLLKIHEDICKQYTDYKQMCNSKTNPLYNYEPMIWIAITFMFIFGLIITFPDVLTNCLRFLFRRF
jgi:hypothetical protein